MRFAAWNSNDNQILHYKISSYRGVSSVLLVPNSATFTDLYGAGSLSDQSGSDGKWALGLVRIQNSESASPTLTAQYLHYHYSSRRLSEGQLDGRRFLGAGYDKEEEHSVIRFLGLSEHGGTSRFFGVTNMARYSLDPSKFAYIFIATADSSTKMPSSSDNRIRQLNDSNIESGSYFVGMHPDLEYDSSNGRYYIHAIYNFKEQRAFYLRVSPDDSSTYGERVSQNFDSPPREVIFKGTNTFVLPTTTKNGYEAYVIGIS